MIEGCPRTPHRRGYCSPHYQRLMKYGDAEAGGIFRDPDRQLLPCDVEGCEQHRYARTWCGLHWSRWKAHGDPLWEPPRRVVRECSVDGCGREAISRGWCSSHYAKWRRHRNPLFQSSPDTRRRVVSRRTPKGYVLLYRPEHPNARKDGRIAEHTVVMSAHLGRPLLPTENVHHRNGVRDDNRIENLELWSRCQPPGKRVADLVVYATNIISVYGSDPNKYP